MQEDHRDRQSCGWLEWVHSEGRPVPSVAQATVRDSRMAHRLHCALFNASQVKSSKNPLHSSILKCKGDSFTTSLDADYIIPLVIICIPYWWI